MFVYSCNIKVATIITQIRGESTGRALFFLHANSLLHVCLLDLNIVTYGVLPLNIVSA